MRGKYVGPLWLSAGVVLWTRVEPWRVREYTRVEFLGAVVFAHQAPISGLARRTRDICCSCEHRCHFEFCARVARVPWSLTESLEHLLKRLLRPQMRKSQGNR